MERAQDPSAGLLPLAWRWRGALGAIVIAGGVMAAANAQSLGLLNIDFGPAQTTELNSAPAQSDGAVGASRPRTPARSRSVDPTAPASAWAASGRVLRIAGGELALDWAGAPPTRSDDEATDDPPDNPEFASIRAPVGGAEALSAGQSVSAPASIASAASGGPSGLGGLGGGTTQPPAAPDAAKAPTGAPDGPLQAGVDPPAAGGPVPEPATWASMILGLGLVGAMLRGSRRRRAA
jgi:hypothetical protein